ncbi:synaptonemal complex protein 1-like [Scomber scombrus]|uniref:Synaptonemal complex protein 1-like n=1 Tax=Scomber scombrus TaxID=13677 RepID=A0AAV1P1I1_SCOSC
MDSRAYQRVSQPNPRFMQIQQHTMQGHLGQPDPRYAPAQHNTMQGYVGQPNPTYMQAQHNTMQGYVGQPNPTYMQAQHNTMQGYVGQPNPTYMPAQHNAMQGYVGQPNPTYMPAQHNAMQGYVGGPNPTYMPAQQNTMQGQVGQPNKYIEAMQNARQENWVPRGPQNPWHVNRFRPQKNEEQPDPWQKISSLKTQIQDCQDREKMTQEKYVAAEKKVSDLNQQVSDLHSESSNAAAKAQSHIEEIGEHLHWAACQETKNFLEQINELKDQLIEANIKLQQQDNSAAEVQLTMKDLQDRLEDRSMDTSLKAEVHKLKIELSRAQKACLLSKAKKDLEDKAAEHMEMQTALRCEIKELTAKLCSEETLTAQSHVKALEMEVQLQTAKLWTEQLKQETENKKVEAALTKAEQENSTLQRTLQEREQEWAQTQVTLETRLVDLESGIQEAKLRTQQLEQEAKENQKVKAALKKAEEEKAILQKTLLQKEEEWAQREAILESRLVDLESRMVAVFEQKLKKKKRNWLVRLFT